MILAPLEKASQYCACHPGLRQGFTFLQQSSIDSLEDGKYEIDGDQVFAIVARIHGSGREAAVLEVHRKYIDIQYIIGGQDVVGWSPLANCGIIRQAYDADSDIEFYADRPTNWIELHPGSFAIFFPDDAHAPLASSGRVHKVVVKVAVKA